VASNQHDALLGHWGWSALHRDGGADSVGRQQCRRHPLQHLSTFSCCAIIKQHHGGDRANASQHAAASKQTVSGCVGPCAHLLPPQCMEGGQPFESRLSILEKAADIHKVTMYPLLHSMHFRCTCTVCQCMHCCASVPMDASHPS
jgi:hypothetical protein